MKEGCTSPAIVDFQSETESDVETEAVFCAKHNPEGMAETKSAPAKPLSNLEGNCNFTLDLVDELTFNEFRLYKPYTNLEGKIGKTIYSHLECDFVARNFSLKMCGEEFSPQELSSSPKIRMGLKFSLCQNKFPKSVARDHFVVFGFEVEGEHDVRVLVCNKST